jgi:hypothetical protein
MHFVQGISAENTLPKFPKLWVDPMQEEIILNYLAWRNKGK